MPLSLARRRYREPTGLPPVHETDLDRILKLIPTEAIAFYAAAHPLSGEVGWRYFMFAVFVAGLVLAPAILYLDGRSTAQAARWSQYLARTLGFAAWAIAIEWPLSPWVAGDALHWARSACVLLVPLTAAICLREPSPSVGSH